MNWFHNRSRNDQVAILLGGFFVCLCLLWVVVVDPLRTAVADARTRVVATENSLAQVSGLVGQLRELKNSQGAGANDLTPHSSLHNLIDTSASATGVPISSMESSASGDSISIRVGQVAENNFYRWLAALEESGQAGIEFLAMTPAAESGQLSSTVRLRSLR